MRELEDLERTFSPMGVAKNEISEAEMIKQKYGNIIDDNLLKQILIDNPNSWIVPYANQLARQLSNLNHKINKS